MSKITRVQHPRGLRNPRHMYLNFVQVWSAWICYAFPHELNSSGTPSWFRATAVNTFTGSGAWTYILESSGACRHLDFWIFFCLGPQYQNYFGGGPRSITIAFSTLARGLQQVALKCSWPPLSPPKYVYFVGGPRSITTVSRNILLILYTPSIYKAKKRVNLSLKL